LLRAINHVTSRVDGPPPPPIRHARERAVLAGNQNQREGAPVSVF